MLYDNDMPVINRYIDLLERLHVFIFDAPVGDITRSFIRQLHWSAIGGLFASGVLFGVSVWAGRVLGTDQYGQYSFAVAIAQIIALLITWSFEIAIVRALVFTRGDETSQAYIISSALFFLVITIVLVNLLLFFLPFSFTNGIVMTFATVLAVKVLFDGMMRGLGLFAYQAAGKAMEALAVLIVFSSMVYLGLFHSYTHYLLSILGGALVLLIWYALRIRSDVSIHRISRSAFQVLWTYGSHAIIWLALPTILAFAAKFTIRYSLGYEFLGQFTVYHMVSISTLAFVGGLISNVLFPIAVQERDSGTMWHKMSHLAAISWFPLWAISSIVTTIAISLYGPSYYLAWWFGIGMALAGVIQFLSSMYLLLIASKDIAGIRYASFHAGIAGLLLIASLAVIIPYHAMWGILASYFISDIYMIWAIRRWKKSL